MGETASGLPDSHVQVGDALLRLTRWIERNQAYAAKQLGLHTTDLACIGYMFRTDGPVTPKQIIQYLGVTSSAGTALLDRLEGAGYIARIPNPDDRRGLLIALDRQAAANPIGFYTSLRDRVTGAIERRTEAERQIISDFLFDVSSSEDAPPGPAPGAQPD